MPEKSRPTDLITQSKAAEKYGVATTTIWRWAKKGLIKRYTNRLGEALYSQAEIDALREPYEAEG